MLIIVIPILGHVVHYCLYIYDARRNEPLESLDDVVYYLKVRLYYICVIWRKLNDCLTIFELKYHLSHLCCLDHTICQPTYGSSFTCSLHIIENIQSIIHSLELVSALFVVCAGFKVILVCKFDIRTHNEIK